MIDKNANYYENDLYHIFRRVHGSQDVGNEMEKNYLKKSLYLKE